MRNAGLLVLVLTAVSPAAAQTGRIIEDSVRSPALEGNLLGDSPVRRLRIYLPPGYATDDTRRYPTVYLLHGYGGDPGSWSDGRYQGLDLRAAMDSLIAGGTVHPFLVVMPDGHNRLGGSVFINSSTTGNWETYLVRDVVRYVEGHYRTLRRASSRGVAGHSMGAGAALRLAMRFPGGFGAAYAMSPNVEEPCRQLNPAERQDLLRESTQPDLTRITGAALLCLGYAAAWSPDSTRPPFFAALPFLRASDSVVTDTAVLERWRAWELLDMAPRYREGLVRLRAIGIDVGRDDPYAPGVVRLDSLLTRLRVRHTVELYDGDHSSRIRERVLTRLLPFFSAALDFGPETN